VAPPDSEALMVMTKAQVLLVLSQDVLDRARVFAGQATMTLKLPVSLQSVLRALIAEGLKRGDRGALLANVERQARAVRQVRSMAASRREELRDAPPTRRKGSGSARGNRHGGRWGSALR
jgi:hypothetical protein